MLKTFLKQTNDKKNIGKSLTKPKRGLTYAVRQALLNIIDTNLTNRPQAFSKIINGSRFQKKLQ